MRSKVLTSVLVTCSVVGMGAAQMAGNNPGAAIDAKALAKTEKEYLLAKKAYDHHHSAGTAHTLVVASDRFALSSMYSSSLSPKIKYRQALRLYREVLKIDPTNHEAKNNSDLIVSIYHSMHRPVPN